MMWPHDQTLPSEMTKFGTSGNQPSNSEPQVEAFIQSIHIELGRRFGTNIMCEHSAFLEALNDGLFDRAWQAVEDARNNGDIDQDQGNVIGELAAIHCIPAPIPPTCRERKMQRRVLAVETDVESSSTARTQGYEHG